MRIMAIDYGDRHTGIALSDLTGTIAGEAFVIDDWNSERLADRIAAEARERGVDTVVLGYPLNMDGSAGPRAEKSLELRELIKERAGLEPVMWDERRTTVDAHRILLGAGKNAKKRKKTVDAVAAALMLEGYLTRRRRECTAE